MEVQVLHFLIMRMKSILLWDLIQNKAEIHENLTTTAYDLFSIEKKTVQSRVYLTS
jgi:hypothetical protein